MLRDARHDDKDEEKEKKMASGAPVCVASTCLFFLTFCRAPSQSLRIF
jgi:hypothetical protein